MDYRLCIICQAIKAEELRSPALDLNTFQPQDTYGLFLTEWENFRAANISIDVSLPITEATVDNLVANEAKWHGNCRRNVRHDRLLRKEKSKKNDESTASTSTSNAETSSISQSCRPTCQRNVSRKRKFSDICLFCKCTDTSEDVLHSFQKVELTEELKKTAVIVNDYDVLAQLSVKDVVANELKYHTACYVMFKRQGEKFMQSAGGHEDDSTEIKILEEYLGIIEEDLAAGRRYFALKTLYKEMKFRAELCNIPPINRTRLKNAILQRFSPMLKEEEGFRNEKFLVCTDAMKDVLQHNLVSSAPSEDYRVLAKAALICRRDMWKQKCYNAQEDGFNGECQKNSVCDRLKYLVGLILFGPSHENDVEQEQATLTIAQLITFNADTPKKHETPLPVYVGLLVHTKFRSSVLVNELSRLGLSINWNRVQYIERQIGQTVLQQFHADNLVCPSEMRSGLFTVGAVDNIDHNPSARTSKDSFHGTAISLFQARNNDYDGIKRNFQMRSNVSDKLQLPHEFTTLPQPQTGATVGPLPVLQEILLERDDNLLRNEIMTEEHWSKHVIMKLNDNHNSSDTMVDAKPAWSAYHARNSNKAVSCISGLFPLFTQSATDPKMILHAMELVRKCTEHLNPSQISVITGDQPVYAIMKALQWSQNSVRDMVVILGGFHTEKHSIQAIGDILQGSGWTHALTEVGIW